MIEFLNLLPRDILYQLAFLGELPLPHPTPPPVLKRRRDDELHTSDTAKFSPETNFQTLPANDLSPTTASPSYQLTSYTAIQTPEQLSAQFAVPTVMASNEEVVWDMAQDIFDFPLPVHSTDLGRMPPNAALGEFLPEVSAEHTGWDMTEEPFSFDFAEATDTSVDEAMFGLWTNAPGGLEYVPCSLLVVSILNLGIRLDDWASYLASVSHPEEQL